LSLPILTQTADNAAAETTSRLEAAREASRDAARRGQEEPNDQSNNSRAARRHYRYANADRGRIENDANIDDVLFMGWLRRNRWPLTDQKENAANGADERSMSDVRR
jgi:hypothetical protein